VADPDLAVRRAGRLNSLCADWRRELFVPRGWRRERRAKKIKKKLARELVL
jgi:hypothetical protein